MAKEEVPTSSKLVAEFVGTFMLVLTVCCNVLSGTSGAFVALSIAAALMTGIYALGTVSGAHFNPAVTVAVALTKNQDWDMSLYYILVQLLGGAAAAVTSSMMFGKAFNLEPGAGYDWTHAAAAEILYTAMLAFVVLNCACARANAGNQYFGLAIGFVIVAGGYSVGSISGANLNPAVSVGIDVASAKLGFGWSIAYTGFQLVGASIAALMYKIVHPEEFGDKTAQTTLTEKLVSEFIGTFFLVLTVGLNVITGSLAAALSIGASLMCMIYALGSVSGAHFNPAVTAAILCSGRNLIDVPTALKYVGAQTAGGITAGLAYALITKGKSFPLGPAATHSWVDAGLAEVLFTFVLSFVVLSVATVKAPSKDMFGLAIGFCVVVGGFAAGGISGGSLNPAVSIAIDFTSTLYGGTHFLNSLAYTVFELLGGALAAVVFSQTHVTEYGKQALLPTAQTAKAA
jgi:aquaporin Z